MFQIDPSQRSSLCGKMTSCEGKTHYVIQVTSVSMILETGDGKELLHKERKPFRVTEIKSIC